MTLLYQEDICNLPTAVGSLRPQSRSLTSGEPCAATGLNFDEASMMPYLADSNARRR